MLCLVFYCSSYENKINTNSLVIERETDSQLYMTDITILSERNSLKMRLSVIIIFLCICHIGSLERDSGSFTKCKLVKNYFVYI